MTLKLMTAMDNFSLGNNRVVYQAKWDTPSNQLSFELQGAYDYFPYGKLLRSFVGGNGQERYLTTQHERDEESISENNFGTGFTNAGARLLDHDVVRWNALDLKAADYPSLSAYSYVAGNPLLFTDPDGKAIRPVNEDARRLLFATIERFGGEDFARAIQFTPSISDKSSFRSNLTNSSAKLFEDANAFRKELKNRGFKLNKEHAQEAFEFYTKLAEGNVTELSVMSKEEGGSSTKPGTTGTKRSEGENPSTNEAYKAFQKSFFENNLILDDLTNGKGFGFLPYKAENSADPDVSHNGTIVIDATGENKASGAIENFLKAIEF